MTKDELFPNIFYDKITYQKYHFVKSDGDYVYLVENESDKGLMIEVLEFMNRFTTNKLEIRKLKIDDILE
jgi:hypothetical protein